MDSKKLMICIFGVVSVVLVCILLFSGCGNEKTVAEYGEELEWRINNELASSRNDLRRRVENAHVTVTVRSAYVSDLRITTKDGSNTAGADGKNIRRIYLEITTRWDGFIHKNGCTVLGMEYENVNGKMKPTDVRIIRTDALVNTEDPEFWGEIAGTAAILLLL